MLTDDEVLALLSARTVLASRSARELGVEFRAQEATLQTISDVLTTHQLRAEKPGLF